MVKNKWLAILAIVLVLPLMMAACGVPNDKYTAMVSERDTFKTQSETSATELAQTKADLESSKSELESLNTQLEKANSDLKSVNSQLQSTRSSLSSANSKVSDLQQSMSKAKVLADLNAAVFVPAIKGQIMTPSEETALGLVFISQVLKSGDPKLQTLFQAWVDSGFADADMVDLFSYSFETIPDLLQQK